MPTLSHHQSNDFVKVLAVGDSKSGKTGSLVSLVKDGYKLGILDMDNLLDPLRSFVERECPAQLENVHFVTLRDTYKASPDGPVIVGQPRAYMNAIKILDYWKTEDEDLGHPYEWGPDWILVIDSLSRLCDAAYDFREPLTPRGRTGQTDARATYGDAQDAIEHNLANLTGLSFRTNVIVFAHLSYMQIQDPSGADRMKAFPQGIGQKLSPKIPQYFPTILHYYNNGGKRTIRTTSTPLLDLANPKPFDVQKEYPIETGLAQIFTILRKEANNAPQIRSHPAKTLRRA